MGDRKSPHILRSAEFDKSINAFNLSSIRITSDPSMTSSTPAKATAPGHESGPHTGPMYLSPASFFADFYVYPALAVIFVSFALYRAPAHWFAVLVAFAIGFGGWTFIEYVMHRYVLHHLTYIKDQHAKHHEDQKALFGTPTWLSLFVILVLATGPTVTYVGLPLGCAFTAGLMLGYLGYTLAHYTIHHWTARSGSYLFRLKQRHALHHHFDEMGNFGVSNGIWDYIFRTNIVVRRDESETAEARLATQPPV